MSELFAASASATLCEVFCIGTATVITPARASAGSIAAVTTVSVASGGVEAVEAKTVQDTVLPVGREDSTPHALWGQLVVIQEGRVKWGGAYCAQSLTPCHNDANADTTS